MNITIVAWGSHGDVRPYIALSLGLQRTNHTVWLATQPWYKEFVCSYGINFVPLDCNAWTARKSSSFIGINHIPFSTIYGHSSLLEPIEDSLLPAFWRVCQGSDACKYWMKTSGITNYQTRCSLSKNQYP